MAQLTADPKNDQAIESRQPAAKEEDKSFWQDVSLALENEPKDCVLTCEKMIEKLDCRACIERNEPSPVVVATDRLNRVLLYVHNMEKDEDFHTSMLHHLVVQLIQPYHSMPRLTSSPNETTNQNSQSPEEVAIVAEKNIRQLQLQVLLRLQFWAFLGKRFVDAYKKGKCHRQQTKKSRKRRRQRDERQRDEVVLSDVLDILSLAALQLPHDQTFAVFLKDTLVPSLFQKTCIPDKTMGKIFDYFEIRNPYETTPVSLPVRRRSSLTKRQPTTRINEREAVSLTGSQDAKASKTLLPQMLTQKAVQLSAPACKRRNSLLAGDSTGHRGRFVGSHFNTNLSNVSSLFRQVTVKKPSSSRRPSLSTSTGVISSTSRMQAKRGLKQNSQFASNKRTKTVISETPVASRKRLSELDGNRNLTAGSGRQLAAAARRSIAMRRKSK